MVEDATTDLIAGENFAAEKKDAKTRIKQKKRMGIIARIRNGFFRQNDDVEKRLQNISKEEVSVLARMKRRSHNWSKIKRHLIISSVILEIIALCFAIMTTRSSDLDWKIRAFRVLPMFLLPGLCYAGYSAIVSLMKKRDRKDGETLVRLRAEREDEIKELKERTNYYITQQLIQRYDTDPAAKAAATTVLASKLGADSGLKVYVEGDTNEVDVKKDEEEFVQSSGLRNRKQLNTGSSSIGNVVLQHLPLDAATIGEDNQPFVEEHHQNRRPAVHGGGWIARIAALLVGEDPTQSYAVICSNCQMHNGLARKEDFAHITYYCPHCNSLNRSKQLEEHVSDSNFPNMSSSATVGSDDIDMADKAIDLMNDSRPTSNSSTSPIFEIEEVER